MNDWIRLLVKYKGKCSACGKEIPAGQHALWSKSSKAIKHSECNTTTTTTTTTTTSSSSKTATTEKKQVSADREQSMAAKVDCFICGKSVVALNDSGFVETEGYGRQAVSQASICEECLKDKNAYHNYQHAFIERARRAAKVKTWV